MNKKTQINNISSNTEQIIKRKTAFALPDRPSESGMRADEIKKAFYSAITDKADSVMSELKRVINEANEVIDEIHSSISTLQESLSNDIENLDDDKVDIAQGTDNANKNLVTTEEGNVSAEPFIYLGNVKVYQETNSDGNNQIVFEFPDAESEGE